MKKLPFSFRPIIPSLQVKLLDSSTTIDRYYRIISVVIGVTQGPYILAVLGPFYRVFLSVLCHLKCPIFNPFITDIFIFRVMDELTQFTNKNHFIHLLIMMSKSILFSFLQNYVTSAKYLFPVAYHGSRLAMLFPTKANRKLTATFLVYLTKIHYNPQKFFQ